MSRTFFLEEWAGRIFTSDAREFTRYLFDENMVGYDVQRAIRTNLPRHMARPYTGVDLIRDIIQLGGIIFER